MLRHVPKLTGTAEHRTHNRRQSATLYPKVVPPSAPATIGSSPYSSLALSMPLAPEAAAGQAGGRAGRQGEGEAAGWGGGEHAAAGGGD